MLKCVGMCWMLELLGFLFCRGGVGMRWMLELLGFLFCRGGVGMCWMLELLGFVFFRGPICVRFSCLIYGIPRQFLFNQNGDNKFQSCWEKNKQ